MTHGGRMVRRVAALLLALVFTVGAAPAHAATAGSLTPPGEGVLYDDCRAVVVPYSITLDPGTDSWSMDVTAYGPDGLEATSDFVYSGADPTRGAAQLQFCGYEDPGTYTVRATGETSDYEASISDRPFTLAPITFTMRQPMSQTTVKRKFSRNTNVLIVSVQDERPNGYFPSDYADVRMQTLVGDRWRNVPHTKHFISGGRVTYRLPHVIRFTKVRAVTKGGSSFTGSESRPVILQ